jgi:hypothetical protein
LMYGTANIGPWKKNESDVIRVSWNKEKLGWSSNVHIAIWGRGTVLISSTTT